jgi:hypothetical protein
LYLDKKRAKAKNYAILRQIGGEMAKKQMLREGRVSVI